MSRKQVQIAPIDPTPPPPRVECYLGHDESDTNRVAFINNLLMENGLSTWFNDGDGREDAKDVILRSDCVLAFVTEAFLDMISGNGPGGFMEACHVSLAFAFVTLGPTKVIPVLLDAGARGRLQDAALSEGKLGRMLGAIACVDMSEDVRAAMPDLVARARSAIAEAPVPMIARAGSLIESSSAPNSADTAAVSMAPAAAATGALKADNAAEAASLHETTADVILPGTPPGGRFHVFVSFHASNRASAQRVVEWLSAQELKTCVAEAGHQAAQLQDQIRHSSVFLLLLSEAYMQDVDADDSSGDSDAISSCRIQVRQRRALRPPRCTQSLHPAAAWLVVRLLHHVPPPSVGGPHVRSTR